MAGIHPASKAYPLLPHNKANMKPLLIAIAATTLLSACAATVKPFTSPSGYQAYHITCSGSADDWTSCYEAATKECQGPYRIIDRMGSNTFTPYGPYVTRELSVECPAWISPNTRKPAG